MSEPNEPLNPLMKQFGSPTDPTSQLAKPWIPGTDPTSQLMKGEIPSTDLTSQLMKGEAPGTDPTSQLMKPWLPGADPLSPVALNPQPLPPVSFRPAIAGGNRMLRTAVNVVGIVCIIAVLAVGGLALQSQWAQSASNSGGPQPGVIQDQNQFHVYQSPQENHASGVAHCAADTPQTTLLERLIGGGFTADDEHGRIVEDQSSYPNGGSGGDTWGGVFVPQAQGLTATMVAICLREPRAFFYGRSAFDTVQSQPVAAAHDDKYPDHAVAVAACPTGEAILGGGYSSEYSGGGVYSIDASYPSYVNGAGEWSVAFHVDPSNGLQRVRLAAYAICASGLKTHLEHQKLAAPLVKYEQYTQDSMTCASGALLTGGYQITTPTLTMVGIGDDSPLSDSTRTPASGDFVQQWYVEAASSGWQIGVSPGAAWVVCLDQSGAKPQATTAPQPTNTPVPRATPTAKPKSHPTNTPISCPILLTGSGDMNADYYNLNVEDPAGIEIDPTTAQVQYPPASNDLTALNGALFVDEGAVGSGGYSGFTCAQLKSAHYSATSVPANNNEVFFVKVADGHLAKVLVTVTSGSFPSFTWTTY
jgi:hypothetical protein